MVWLRCIGHPLCRAAIATVGLPGWRFGTRLIAQMRGLLPTRHPLHQPEIQLLHQPGLAKQILRPRAALQQLVQLLVGNRHRPCSSQEAGTRSKIHRRPDISVFRGHAEPPDPATSLPPGVIALRTALEAGSLTILAVGPLTNIAVTLEGRPDLHGDITRIVAVMGNQPGNLFHPTQDKESGGCSTIRGCLTVLRFRRGSGGN